MRGMTIKFEGIFLTYGTDSGTGWLKPQIFNSNVFVLLNVLIYMVT